MEDLSKIILIAAGTVALIGIVLALLSEEGRRKFAELGVRVAVALIEALIGKISSERAEELRGRAQKW